MDNLRPPPTYDFTEGSSSRPISAARSISSDHDSQQNDVVPPADDHVVLTWNDGAEVIGSASAVEAVLSATTDDRPPDYVQAQRPRVKVTYTFSPLGMNSLVLLPPPDAPDSRPQYFISVAMNCFMPLSHVTTVYRGANEYAPRVGEFEMGIMSAASSRVQMGSHPSVPIQTAITKWGSRENALWKWQPVFMKIKNLTWDYNKKPFECRAQVPGSLAMQTIATFTTHLRPYMPQHTLDNISKLEIYPAGQKFFDEIIMSLLIIERRRLTPNHIKGIFNY